MRYLAKRIGPRGAATCLLLTGLAGGLLVCSCKFGDLARQQQATLGTKGLWIANGTSVVEYLPSQMVGGASSAAPHIILKSAAFGSARGVNFDAGGNLWVMDPAARVNGVATAAVFGFSAAQVAALGSHSSPEPLTVITSSSLKSPQQSAFDAQGNQWIADHDSNTVVVFTAGQLAQTGLNIPPAVIISSAAFNGPLGIAFDGAGNLWVANEGGVAQSGGGTSSIGTTIVEFAAAKLPAPPTTGMLTPDLTPDITLRDDGDASIQGPWGMTFDTSGNLWSSNAVPSTLVEFDMSSLASSGAPMPAVIISSTTMSGDATLADPHGICFDDRGNIAVVNSGGSFSVALYGQSQLMTGAPTPDTFLVGSSTSLSAPQGCVFGPAIK